MSYTHILVAIETQQDSDVLLSRAQALAKLFSARLSLINVVQYIPMEPMQDMAIAGTVEMTNELMASAEARMASLCERFGLPGSAGHVALGSAGGSILNSAEELKVDLILIGHHPRQGLFSGLFGHTDNSVVRGAMCDVLAIALATEP